MSDDLMRLSDLLPTYARYYKVSSQEAAYALHELIEVLYDEQGVRRGRPNSINNIFWVGSAGGSKRASRSYVLYFQEMSKYFYDFIDSPLVDGKNLLSCFCEEAQQSVSIPAGAVYFSRSALSEWVVNSGLESPEFLSRRNVLSSIQKGGSNSEFKEQELGTISKAMNGLVDLIKAVDRAHRESPADYDGKKRADNIRRYAYVLSNPPRAKFDVYSALISLAEEAGIDLPADHRTLRKYMRPQP